ncbi:Olfactory receptor 1E2 [Oryzias melastigma]|uniref:Olfactory receptor 1E2 n=1 Tax=Oryzias melastigma TaxID=30732 RepID=A0A834C900_ORYME|nr:Olfactory receptor 1E2 [Oryzias melastigma]
MGDVDTNFTTVSEFLIVGFPDLQREYFHLVAWFFFVLYVITVVGNLILVVVFALEPSLQKPMYIIMVSLALSDIGFTTVALPKLIARYWWNDGSIGVHTCFFQRHMIHYFGSLNSLILLTMALDRCLAVCFPFRYPLLMTVPNMLGLTVFSWIIAHIFPGIGTINFTFASFCGPNRIIQAFCDTLSLTALVCGETNQYGASYGFIIAIYYLPRFFVYSTPFFPNLTMTADKRMVTTLFYSFFPPLINPFIYCLRTKEIQDIFKRWIQRQKSIAQG